MHNSYQEEPYICTNLTECMFGIMFEDIDRDLSKDKCQGQIGKGFNLGNLIEMIHFWWSGMNTIAFYYYKLGWTSTFGFFFVSFKLFCFGLLAKNVGWLSFPVHDRLCTTRTHMCSVFFFLFSNFFVSRWARRKFYLCLTLCKMGTSAQCASPQYCRCDDEIKGKYKKENTMTELKILIYKGNP